MDNFDLKKYLAEGTLMNEPRNMYQELNDILNDYQGNVGDQVDAVYNWIEKNYDELGRELNK